MWRSSYDLRQGRGSTGCCGGRQGAGGCWMSAGHGLPVSLRCTVMEKIKIPHITRRS